MERLIKEVEQLITASYEALPPGCRRGAFQIPFQRLSVSKTFLDFGGIDISGITSGPQLADLAIASGIDVVDNDYVRVFSRVFATRVEPDLASIPALLLTEFPAPLCAMARLSSTQETLAERFELYLGGVEVANALLELVDPVEQQQRLAANQRERARRQLPVHEIDDKLIEALKEGLPPCYSIASGVDRLLAVLLGVDGVEKTVPFTQREL